MLKTIFPFLYLWLFLTFPTIKNTAFLSLPFLWMKVKPSTFLNLCRKYITYLSHPLPHIKQWHTWHHRKPHDLEHFKIAEQDIFCMFSVIKIKQCRISLKVYMHVFSYWAEQLAKFRRTWNKNKSPLSSSPSRKPTLFVQLFQPWMIKYQLLQNIHGKGGRDKKNTTGIDAAQIISKTSLQNLLWVLPLIHILLAHIQP